MKPFSQRGKLLSAGLLITALSMGVGALGGGYMAAFTDTNGTTPVAVTAGTLTLSVTGDAAYLVDRCGGPLPAQEVANANGVYQLPTASKNLWLRIPLKVELPGGWSSSKLAVQETNFASLSSPGSSLASLYPHPFAAKDAFLMDAEGNRLTSITRGGTYDLYIPANVPVESIAGRSWPEGSAFTITPQKILVDLKQEA